MFEDKPQILVRTVTIMDFPAPNTLTNRYDQALETESLLDSERPQIQVFKSTKVKICVGASILVPLLIIILTSKKIS